MTFPQRGTPELKVFFSALREETTRAETWFFEFARGYERRTFWKIDVHGRGGPGDACRCLTCGVPPEPNEYVFIHFGLSSGISRLCLDCAFQDAVDQGWLDMTANVPRYVYAVNAVREGGSNVVVE